MKTLFLALLSLAVIPFAQQPTGPTCILSPCFFNAPQEGHIIWHPDGSYTCDNKGPCKEPSAQEINAHVPAKIDWKIGGTAISTISAAGKLFVAKEYPDTVSVESQTGRIDRLTPVEYAGLQKLRQAVADEETRVAKAHGVRWKERMVNDCSGDICASGHIMQFPQDSYEFRGQFLLINVPDASAEGKAK